MQNIASQATITSTSMVFTTVNNTSVTSAVLVDGATTFTSSTGVAVVSNGGPGILTFTFPSSVHITSMNLYFNDLSSLGLAAGAHFPKTITLKNSSGAVIYTIGDPAVVNDTAYAINQEFTDTSFTLEIETKGSDRKAYLLEVEVMAGATDTSTYVDTLRKITTGPSLIYVDTLRRIVNSLPPFKNLELSLAPRTLTDKFTIVTPAEVDKQQRFSGQIKDFSFVFMADETSTQKNITTVTGVYEIQDLLDKPVFFTAADTKASTLLTAVCRQIGRTVNITIDDFTTANNQASKPTFQEFIGNILSWTDKVPSRLIHVYIRNGSIYVLQRGKESGSTAIDKYNNDTVTRKTLKLLKDSTDTAGNAVSGILCGGKYADSSDDATGYKNGTVTNGDSSITYVNGLVMQESHPVDGGQEVTEYTYGGSFPNVLKRSEVTTGPSGKVETDYQSNSNGDLVKETRKEYNTSGNLLKTRITRHYPLGKGDWGTSVEEDGVTVSSGIGQGPPSAKASPYTIKLNSKNKTTVGTIGGVPAVIMSARMHDYLGEIPVYDTDSLQAIADEIIRLDRKTEERVSMDVYDDHIYDFSQRILWQGNEYYLENNTVTLGAREYVQKLELVRWIT